MANALYDLGREGFLDGSIDWDTDDIRILGCSASYAVNLATHKFVSDLTNILVRSAAGVAGKTVTAGVANHSVHTWVAVPAGTAIRFLVYYKFNASDAAARLIAYIDTATGVGLPVTPNGGDITITPDTGANKVFKL